MRFHKNTLSLQLSIYFYRTRTNIFSQVSEITNCTHPEKLSPKQSPYFLCKNGIGAKSRQENISDLVVRRYIWRRGVNLSFQTLSNHSPWRSSRQVSIHIKFLLDTSEACFNFGTTTLLKLEFIKANFVQGKLKTSTVPQPNKKVIVRWTKFVQNWNEWHMKSLLIALISCACIRRTKMFILFSFRRTYKN